MLSAGRVDFVDFKLGYNEKKTVESGGVARTVITRAQKKDDKRVR